MRYSLYNNTKRVVLAEKLLIADRFWSRMIGLLGRKELPGREALLIVPCNSIHTMFMRYPIDVLFINRDFFVLKTLENFRPWRIYYCRNKVFQVVELKAGTIAKTGTAVGDKLVKLSKGGD